MIAVEDCVLVLLAAGNSERYGDVGSKLDEKFLTRPLGLHVTVALEDMPFRARVAVVGKTRLDYAAHGYHVIENPRAAEGIAHSIHLGVGRAKELGAAAVVIALADMPRVTATHIYNLLAAADGDQTVVASSDGRQTSPPALFGRAQFDFLLALEGEEGAREMVRAGRHVVASPAELLDVDTPEELERLRELVHDPAALTRVGARRL